MKNLLKTYYQFTDYQIAQLHHLSKTIFSEISKLLIMGIFFRNELDIFCAAIITLWLLRISTGGIHCKTYISCFLLSFTYMFISIRLLPLIPINKLFQMILLFVCIQVNYRIGPVTSDIHLPLTQKYIKKGRLNAFVIIFFFLVITYIIPENKYITACFWIIILHTLQLIIAKIRKKGDLA